MLRWALASVLAVQVGGVLADDARAQCDDLVIGAPGDTESGVAAGAVNVLNGGLDGLTTVDDALFHQDSAGVPGEAEADDYFGGSVASGDFDGDLAADVAIGVPGEAIGALDGAGLVNVLYGNRESGLSGSGAQSWDQSSDGIPGGPESGDYFGSALAVGDFDHDGYDDLVVGAWGEDLDTRTDAGAVWVIFGSADGLSAAHAETWNLDDDGVPGFGLTDDRFGFSLAVGDFDGSGRDDLAIGAPGQKAYVPTRLLAGAVYVLYSDSSGLSTAGFDKWRQDDLLGDGASGSNDFFGWALAAGDFDDDGYDDLAMGAPFDNDPAIDAGQVNVLYGGPSGLSAASHEVWTQQLVGDDLGSDQFGRSLATGDFNHDGYDDLAVGSPREDVELTDGPTYADAGSTWIFYGSAAGLRATGALGLDRGLTPVDGVPRDGDHFGEALGVGDFDCNGADDLAIGVPGDDIGYIDAGSVNVIYGIPVIGLFPIDDQLFAQGEAGMNGSARAFEELGYALAGVPELWWIFTDGFESGDADRWSDIQGVVR